MDTMSISSKGLSSGDVDTEKPARPATQEYGTARLDDPPLLSRIETVPKRNSSPEHLSTFRSRLASRVGITSGRAKSKSVAVIVDEPPAATATSPSPKSSDPSPAQTPSGLEQQKPQPTATKERKSSSPPTSALPSDKLPILKGTQAQQGSFPHGRPSANSSSPLSSPKVEPRLPTFQADGRAPQRTGSIMNLSHSRAAAAGTAAAAPSSMGLSRRIVLEEVDDPNGDFTCYTIDGANVYVPRGSSTPVAGDKDDNDESVQQQQQQQRSHSFRKRSPLANQLLAIVSLDEKDSNAGDTSSSPNSNASPLLNLSSGASGGLNLPSLARKPSIAGLLSTGRLDTSKATATRRVSFIATSPHPSSMNPGSSFSAIDVCSLTAEPADGAFLLPTLVSQSPGTQRNGNTSVSSLPFPSTVVDRKLGFVERYHNYRKFQEERRKSEPGARPSALASADGGGGGGDAKRRPSFVFNTEAVDGIDDGGGRAQPINHGDRSEATSVCSSVREGGGLALFQVQTPGMRRARPSFVLSQLSIALSSRGQPPAPANGSQDCGSPLGVPLSSTRAGTNQVSDITLDSGKLFHSFRSNPPAGAEGGGTRIVHAFACFSNGPPVEASTDTFISPSEIRPIARRSTARPIADTSEHTLNISLPSVQRVSSASLSMSSECIESTNALRRKTVKPSMGQTATFQQRLSLPEASSMTFELKDEGNDDQW